MAGRFRRLNNLDHSQDITTSPEINYSDTSFYDEPQSFFSGKDRTKAQPKQVPSTIYTDDDRRKMSHTTRKPVAGSRVTSPSPTLPQAYSKNLPALPQSYTASPPQPQCHVAYHSPYQYQSPSIAQQEPLIPPAHTSPPRSSSSSQTSPPEKQSRESSKPRKPSVIAKSISKTASAIWTKARRHQVSHISTPLWAAPWRHQLDVDTEYDKFSTVRHFNPPKQRRRIFFHFFFKWLVPVFFCAAMAIVLSVYSSKSKISHQQKYVFNALVVGISLCLGFVVVDGMKGYANILRWRLLAQRFRPLQEVELILNLSSQKSSMRLLWVARTEGQFLPNRTQLFVFVYLLFMFGFQLVIALLGLAISVDVAPLDYNLEWGDVSIADLAHFQQNSNLNLSISNDFLVQSAAINAFGATGSNYYYEVQNNVSLIDYPLENAPELYTDESTTWWYRFVDQCPGNACDTAYKTKRWVKASAKCVSYTVTSGGFVAKDTMVSYTDSSGRPGYIGYFGPEEAGSTTYYANTVTSCGPRCTTIFVVNIGLNEDEKLWHPQVFQCTNTVSQVLGTDRLQNPKVAALGDEQARLVAGAVGYNGASWRNHNTSFQAHTYDIGSEWSYYHTNGAGFTTTDVANLIMRYSMGAVAAIDLQFGQRETTMGDTPIVAQKVNVKRNNAILILVLVPSVQFLFLLFAVFWGNAVIVRDGSFLSTAALLRPVVEKLERSGCALTSDEICNVLRNPNVAYGVCSPNMSAGDGDLGIMTKGNDEIKHLDILFEDGPVSGAELRSKMEAGRYDGLTG